MELRFGGSGALVKEQGSHGLVQVRSTNGLSVKV
jgi:hypothetical protein